MSQSAENQFAIIENENNSNIVMESQASVMNTSDIANVDNTHATESRAETPVQDEVGDNMEGGEGPGDSGQTLTGDIQDQDKTVVGSCVEDAELGSGGDANQSSTLSGEGRDYEERGETMDIDRPHQSNYAAAGNEQEPAEAEQADNGTLDYGSNDNVALDGAEDGRSRDAAEQYGAQADADSGGDAGSEWQEGQVTTEDTQMDVENEQYQQREDVEQGQQVAEQPGSVSFDQGDSQTGEEFVSAEEEDRLLAEENLSSPGMAQEETDNESNMAYQHQTGMLADEPATADEANSAQDMENQSDQVQNSVEEQPWLLEGQKGGTEQTPYAEGQPEATEQFTEDNPETAEQPDFAEGEPEITEHPEPVEGDPETSEQPELNECEPGSTEDVLEAIDSASAAVYNAEEVGKDAPVEMEEGKEFAEESCERFDDGEAERQGTEFMDNANEENKSEAYEVKDTAEDVFDAEKQDSEVVENMDVEDRSERVDDKDVIGDGSVMNEDASEEVSRGGGDFTVAEESNENPMDTESAVADNAPEAHEDAPVVEGGSETLQELPEAPEDDNSVQGVFHTAEGELEQTSQSLDHPVSSSVTEQDSQSGEMDAIDESGEPVTESGEPQETEGCAGGDETAPACVETTDTKPIGGAEDDGSSAQALDTEADAASDATIEDGRDADVDQMLKVEDVKSGAEAESEINGKGSADAPEAMEVETSTTGSDSTVKASAEIKSENSGENGAKVQASPAEEDDDVVVLDDDGEKEVLNSNNDMGIQIASVSGGADDVHESAEQSQVKQENEQKPQTTVSPMKTQGSSSTKKSKTQTCIVCKKVGKCKYNIVRNGDIKHLCDDTCFKRFRSNPTMFLKGAGSEKKGSAGGKAAVASPTGQTPAPPAPGYKTCIVCLLMNINTQGQFCAWKGLDFCGEGCLGKFQAGVSSTCAVCKTFIPVASRCNCCLRLGNEVKPFCGSRCQSDYKLHLRLCAMCQKDLATAPDSFSAPVGSGGTFKEFCTKECMTKFEEMLQADVEVIRVEAWKRSSNTCSVCQKKEITKHSIKTGGKIHNLCSDACLSAFQYSNKVDIKTCDLCNTRCGPFESSLHTVQYEGQQKRFCSDVCLTKFGLNHRKLAPCAWCGTQRENLDMIERVDANNKCHLFCSLNCLSLYRVNLQAKSNQPVKCDQCLKVQPAQYHLTMSDASVRNFCSYNCVMSFQAQFAKGVPPPPAAAAPPPPPPPPPPPKHKHNTRGRASRGSKQAAAAAGSPSFPIISNVISLAPQGGQKVNIKNSSGAPVVVSGASPGSTVSQVPPQQQIIIQPPPPKPVKNKSVLCKPFVQTKATSCRPHTQTKHIQTDEVKAKPVMIPMPVPIYLPTPMALYSAPAPTPVFIPVPIPVPIFIPTTRKSANGIMKQIKEIREKTPSDPLEAELLMMAAAVSADGKNSSDSESDEEMAPEIRSRKRSLAADDDDDADVMPLTSNKEEVTGEEDMISMALRMAEEMSGPITDLESAVEAVPVNTDPPPQPPRPITPDAIPHEDEMIRSRRGGKRGGNTSNRRGSGRPPKRPRMQIPQPEPIPIRQEPPAPPPPPADANYHLKFTYGVNAWRHWVLFKNNQIERNAKPGCGRIKLFKTDIMQCTADELNFSLCLFVKEVRKPNGEEYSPDSIYYLTLGIQQYLFENGRIDNIFTDIYYEKFTECLTEILSKCQPKFNASGQMVCRIEEEHLWECKQLGAHSPYVLLNTLIYFHTKYFILKTPEDHMKLSFAHILKYWKKGQQQGKGGQPARSVSLRYYSVSTAKKDGSAPTSTTKKGSKDGIPVYEVTENQDNPLRCPVKLYEFYLSKCPESIKNRSDIFYPVPERSCVPDSPVWYSTTPISLEVMTKMLTRILLVREIQEAHLHAQPIYV